MKSREGVWVVMLSPRCVKEASCWRAKESQCWIEDNCIPHTMDDTPDEVKKSFELRMAPGHSQQLAFSTVIGRVADAPFPSFA